MIGVTYYDVRRKYRRSRPFEVIPLKFKKLNKMRFFKGRLINISKNVMAFLVHKNLFIVKTH